ncbi:MAG: LTA synthase family protein [Candidatus Gastranaerophilales bacterium]|nr:LTA synthase family protein [Candidatus Gastranaerophilales bacterium]
MIKISGLILLISLMFFLLTQHYFNSLKKEKILLRKKITGFLIILLLPVLSYFTISDNMSEISYNKYENNLIKNGIHSLFSAFINNKLDYKDFYLTLDEKKIKTKIKNLYDIRNYQNNLKHKIFRKIKKSGIEQKYNVILITVESLSSDFLGAFGNKQNLTPNLDKIAEKSIFFTNFYATGTRTVRGLEAISLSFPPTPGRSIIKRPNNENMLSSIGKIFQQKGYQNKYIYGGHGYFDNMNYFFENNGFSIVDRTDMSNDEITFSTAWGVCDENLFDRAIKECDKSYKKHQPFFNLIMTTSNHRPYKYPDLRIDIKSGTGREGAVKYTDYAIGKFINSSKRKKWFKNTIFIIVADHCASSAGREELNVKKYHIPFMIYAPGILHPEVITKLCSQIDVAPTILDIMNWSYNSYFFGKSIFKMNRNEERAFIANYQKLGLLKNKELIVLSPQKESNLYAVDLKNYFIKQNNNFQLKKNMEELAICYYQTAYDLFREHESK